LLADYLLNERSLRNLESGGRIVLESGSWDRLRSKPQYILKKLEDRISYGWDDMINRAHEGSPEYERIARELARPGRFERRYLAKAFYDAHVQAHEDDENDLLRRTIPMESVTYCFLFADDQASREGRRAMLGAMCFVARGEFRRNTRVIGIATEKLIEPTVPTTIVS
jgi:hypothetical protein